MSNTKETAARPLNVVPAPVTAPALDLLNDAGTEGAIAEFKRRIEGRERFIRVMVKHFGTNGWANFDGNPYLEGWQAAKYLNAVGVRFKEKRFDRVQPEKKPCKRCDGEGEREGREGGTYKCKACSGTGRIGVPFWTVHAQAFRVTPGGDPEHLGEFMGIHTEDGYTIDPQKAMAAAEQNMKSRAARDLFDLGTITWDDLKGMGVDTGEKERSGARFERGSQGGTGGAVESPSQRGKVYALMGELSLAENQKKWYRDRAKEQSGRPDGKISAGVSSELIDTLQRLVNEREKGAGPEGDESDQLRARINVHEKEQGADAVDFAAFELGIESPGTATVEQLRELDAALTATANR